SGEPLHHWGGDNPGTHGIDPDVRLRVVEGRRLSKADNAVFRGGVSGLTFEAFDPGARRGVHDRAAALLEHQRNLVFQAQEHTAKIDADDPVPLLLGDFGSGRDWLFNACVVEGKVEAAELLKSSVQSSLHL